MKLSSLLYLFCLLTIGSVAQTGFNRITNIPVHSGGGQLELPWAGGLNFPMFSEIDLNGDNVSDMFIFDKSNNRVSTYINTGASGIHCWQYAPQYADQFPPLRSWAYLYDYNCDNKPDLFTCNFRNNGIVQYRNDSQGQTIVFTLVDSSMKYNYTGSLLTNIGASAYLAPTFNDMDNDGDMDIIALQLQCLGGFAYYKNLSMEHTGTCDSLSDFVIEHNVWGEFALRSGGYQYVAVGSWNINCFLFSPPEPKFDPISEYYVAERDDTYASIFTIDIDNDGDKDAIIGDSGADNSLLIINGGDSSHAVMVSQDTLFPSYDIPVDLHSFTLHAYIDADNDGVKDLLVSPSEWENNKGVILYRNTGSNELPQFQYVTNDFLQKEMIDVGECATAVLFDFDADGVKDLIIGNRYRTLSDTTAESSLTLYRNNGTSTSPAFEFISRDFAGLKAMNLTGQLFPAFGDIDNDLDQDMIVGLDNGVLVYFENTAGPGVPVSFGTPVYNYAGIDVGQAAAPQLVDMNRDGFLDLVIGQKNGLIKYFENTLSLSTPFNQAATIDTLGKVVLQYPQSTDGFIVPFVFEQNGDYRLAAAYMEGVVYLYGSIDGNLNGNFTLLDSIINKQEGYRYGYNLSVSGGDLNGDTLTDLVFGLYGGGVQVYYQENLLNSVSDIADDMSLTVLPNPASDKFIIKSSEQTARCLLFEISGRLVANAEITGGYAVMNVSHLAEGTYFVHINSTGKVTTRKVVISR